MNRQAALLKGYQGADACVLITNHQTTAKLIEQVCHGLSNKRAAVAFQEYNPVLRVTAVEQERYPVIISN